MHQELEREIRRRVDGIFDLIRNGSLDSYQATMAMATTLGWIQAAMSYEDRQGLYQVPVVLQGLLAEPKHDLDERLAEALCKWPFNPGKEISRIVFNLMDPPSTCDSRRLNWVIDQSVLGNTMNGGIEFDSMHLLRHQLGDLGSFYILLDREIIQKIPNPPLTRKS